MLQGADPGLKKAIFSPFRHYKGTQTTPESCNLYGYEINDVSFHLFFLSIKWKFSSLPFLLGDDIRCHPILTAFTQLCFSSESYLPPASLFLFNTVTRCPPSWPSPSSAPPSPSPTSSTSPPSTGCSVRDSTYFSRSPLLHFQRPFGPGPVPPIPGVHQVQALLALRLGRPRRQHVSLVGNTPLKGGTRPPGPSGWFGEKCQLLSFKI